MPDGVTCVGGLTADVLAIPVHVFPAPATQELTDEVRLAPGGCAVNAASALARLGVPARLIARTGDDAVGDFLRQVLSQRGVDISGLRRTSDAGTAASIVFVMENGERCMLHAIGSMRTFSEDDIDWDVAARSRIFFVAQALQLPAFDGEPMRAALERARSLGMHTAMDVGWDTTGAWSRRIEACYPLLDYFVPSWNEAREMTGESDPPAMCRFFHDRGVGTVGIKLGAEGCHISGPEGEFDLAAFPVQVRDTLGAGDAWCAGFLTGVLRGMPLAEAGRFANAVGACCVSHNGSYDGIRSMADTLAFMHEGGQR